MLSCTLYGLYSITVTGFGELYPLFLATAPKYGKCLASLYYHAGQKIQLFDFT